MNLKTNQFIAGESVKIKATDEMVTVLRCKFIKNMKRYSYVVKENPSTFYFEEELIKK
ncbi:hypothetical protein [Fictibacillus fluitans]|uniref:DUF2187 domain-containing protein n=1 Tax=Fictibacillus fluitans TaxID=3058422 RepID=A0ABT8HR81_9BACL|nr:hypothetical protein [Fictibacillus sp. NE201]MDN4523274.1 hypothetical protein [Fictibacillus sp. NE201]